MAGTLTISGQATNDLAGSRTFGPFTITGSQPIGETLELALASGDNTIQIPAGASAALILTPAGSGTLKLRSSLNSADAGLPLANGQPAVYPFPVVPPTTLIVNSSAAQTAFLTVAFI